MAAASAGGRAHKKAKKLKKSRKIGLRGPACSPSELATDERQNQQGGVVAEFVPARVGASAMVKRHRAAVECQLDIYLRRGKIDEAQFNAGMKFREAWMFQVLGIKTIDHASTRVNSSVEDTFIKIAQSARVVREALSRGVLTLEQRLTLTHVCGDDLPLGPYHRLCTLLRALTALARLWKL